MEDIVYTLYYYCNILLEAFDQWLMEPILRPISTVIHKTVYSETSIVDAHWDTKIVSH